MMTNLSTKLKYDAMKNRQIIGKHIEERLKVTDHKGIILDKGNRGDYRRFIRERIHPEASVRVRFGRHYKDEHYIPVGFESEEEKKWILANLENVKV